MCFGKLCLLHKSVSTSLFSVGNKYFLWVLYHPNKASLPWRWWFDSLSSSPSSSCTHFSSLSCSTHSGGLWRSRTLSKVKASNDNCMHLIVVGAYLVLTKTSSLAESELCCGLCRACWYPPPSRVPPACPRGSDTTASPDPDWGQSQAQSTAARQVPQGCGPLCCVIEKHVVFTGLRFTWDPSLFSLNSQSRKIALQS